MPIRIPGLGLRECAAVAAAVAAIVAAAPAGTAVIHGFTAPHGTTVMANGTTVLADDAVPGGENPGPR